MEPSMLKGLRHNDYERRKIASLQVETLVRDLAHDPTPDNEKRTKLIISQLYEYAAPRSSEGVNSMSTRSGGMIGLAGVTLSMGPDLLPAYLAAILQPVIAALDEAHPNIRFYATESLYNITKVAQGEILPYFNEVFDTMCKLVADTEVSIKNGAELLDRTLKDIVAEYATTWTTPHGPPDHAQDEGNGHGIGLGFEKPLELYSTSQTRKAFSLARLIPLVRERIYVLNPFTRTFIISWLQLLDTVPDLQLISFLPQFLEGLLFYLSDPTAEVRNATEGLLEGLLREVRKCREVELEKRRRRWEWERMQEERRRVRRLMSQSKERQKMERRASEAKTVRQGEEKEAGEGDESALAAADDSAITDGETDEDEDDESEVEYDLDSTEWHPGEGVEVNYAAIIEILVKSLDSKDEEIQSTCLHWVASFLEFVPGVLIPFAPKIIPAMLKALAHHVPTIQETARDTNEIFFSIVQALPNPEPRRPNNPPAQPLVQQHNSAPAALNSLRKDISPTLAQNPPPRDRAINASPPPAPSSIPFPSSSTAAAPRHDRNKPGSDASIGFQPISHQPSAASLARFVEPPSADQTHDSTDYSYPTATDESSWYDDYDLESGKFDYASTVNEVTFALVSENEETQVAALQWLLMMHQKAPRKIMTPSDARLPPPTFPDPGPAGTGRQRQASGPTASSAAVNGISIALLLKILSESTERVLRYNIQLVAQISTCSVLEELGIDYFPAFMKGVLDLFSTDRKLLETKGSFIIRQLCSQLNPDRIYRTCAELLEKDEDLEFSSVMVQNLSLIMITSPELADFRRRLRSLDTKDGQNLFSALYRSWSHNAVATFTLCLLAQAYEQACALLQIFAELEVTVPLLIQIDKLVQLLESPVFTSLRLQLLEPEKHPYLLKALYGLLMLLPQSSAFATLRNRLSAVSSLGFLQTIPRNAFSGGAGARGSTITSPVTSTPLNRRDGPTDANNIRWNELLTHFRTVQKRRAALFNNSPTASGGTASVDNSFDGMSPLGGGVAASSYAGSAPGSRILPTGRRRPTNPIAPSSSSRSDGSLAGTFGAAGSGFLAGGSGASRIVPARPSLGGASQAGSNSSIGIVREGSATPSAAQRAVSPTPQIPKRRVLVPSGGTAGAGPGSSVKKQ
ncbi:hypothetical protein JCM10212_006137 [Sporobolomyces blumeae]